MAGAGSGAGVVLVTGARRGIGRAVAARFLSEGWKVALNDVEATDLAETAGSLTPNDWMVSSHPADVGDREQVEDLVAEVHETHGRLDVLVANAGVIRFGPFLEYPASDFEETLRVNLTGVFHCTQVVARRWIEDGSPGSIVIVTSVSAHQARPGHSAYGASKAGAEILARMEAMELGPHGIRVNCVAPGGPIMTEFVAPRAAAPGFEERVRSTVPLGRVGTPEEVAGVVWFLSGEDASYMTGAVVVVDGGVSLGRP